MININIKTTNNFNVQIVSPSGITTSSSILQIYFPLKSEKFSLLQLIRGCIVVFQTLNENLYKFTTDVKGHGLNFCWEDFPPHGKCLEILNWIFKQKYFSSENVYFPIQYTVSARGKMFSNRKMCYVMINCKGIIFLQ